MIDYKAYKNVYQMRRIGAPGSEKESFESFTYKAITCPAVRAPTCQKLVHQLRILIHRLGKWLLDGGTDHVSPLRQKRFFHYELKRKWEHWKQSKNNFKCSFILSRVDPL